MSQTKAQLLNPLHGNLNVTGSVGIISANYFVAQNPIQSDISGNITGTACTFTTLVGALTGDATGLSGSPNIVVNNLTVNGFCKSGFPQIYFCPIESMSIIPFFLYIFDKNLANIII